MNIQIGHTTTCTALVKDIEGPGMKSAPTGTVTWTTNGSGSFAGNPCTRAPVAGGADDDASCSVTYTQAATGTPTITASYNGSDVHKTSSDSLILAVFDPNGGFVTGGGWIMSPAGACKLPSCTDGTVGKANFGFVSKYQNGAKPPTGQTEFQFKAGNLNFHSSSYEVLIISGCKAQYRGTGTINGSGNYEFTLTAYDAQFGNGRRLCRKEQRRVPHQDQERRHGRRRQPDDRGRGHRRGRSARDRWR